LVQALTTLARTIGFDVDPTVNSFTVYVVLAADVRDRSAQPTIAVSQSNALFSALARGTSPGAQVIHVSNAGGGALTGLSSGVSYETGQPQGWLTASLSATAAPADLTLQAVTSTLDPGVYQATVALASPGAGNTPLSISVGLLVGQPLITLAPTHVEVIVGIGGTRSQLIQVTSASGVPISDLATHITYGGPGTGWLTATLSGTTTPTTLTLTETSEGLSFARSFAQVHVSSPLGAAQPLLVQVDLRVLPDLTFTGTPIIAARVGTVTVTDLVVINQGVDNGSPNAAGPYTAGVCMSATASITGCLPGVEAFSERPGLAASAVDHLPPLQVLAAPGVYHVIAYVDPPNAAAVNESDETNNVRDLGVVVVPAPEVCDGIDNDLDGLTDEGFSLPCSAQPSPFLFLFPDPLMIQAGSSGTLRVTISPAQPTATTVALAISPSTTGVVPATVTILPFETFASFDVTGLSSGTAVITASLSGFTASSTVIVE
jgi:hypothetical protein